MDTNPDIEARIEDLLRHMTWAEKIALMSGQDKWRTAAIERLGIPALIMTDGPHGVRNEVAPGRTTGPTTAFPTGVSLAASWNPELVERVGAALGEETRGMGCDVLLGPCVNIVRHPLAGRNFESYSEDPCLAGQIGAAWVRGVQSRGVGASLKHFACNNQETERMRGNSVVDERALREIYLAHFQRIVQEARPWTVMCAYNRLNGAYCSENAHLLREILKGEWGFDGVVVSDWGANHTIAESARGGLDIEMPGPPKYYGNLLEEAVYTWQVEKEAVDDAARRVLRLLARVGKLGPRDAPAGSVNTPEHQALAREAAEEAITLLKNERGVLPLSPRALHSLAVLGPNATCGVVSGGGSSYVEPPYRVSPLEGLQARLPEGAIRYEEGCGHKVQPDEARATIAQAVDAARKAEVAVILAGYPDRYETEGADRPDLGLTGHQDELIQAVAAANPNTVVVLNVGAPVAMPWLESVVAVVLAYYPGLENGNAVARVLLGEVNPSGKLPVTFPKRLEDTPAYINYPGGREVRYGEGMFVGYRYYDARDVEPLFPFGHGLSYTSFTYSDLRLPATVQPGEPVQVAVTVTNSGNRPGKEVVQLYLHNVDTGLPGPIKALKRFAKVELQPGEARQVSWTLDERDLAFYNPVRQGWVVEPGSWEVLVGSSSRDIRVVGTLALNG